MVHIVEPGAEARRAQLAALGAHVLLERQHDVCMREQVEAAARILDLGAQRAAQGELTILASGSAAAFAKARPALDAMAAKLYELGDAAGQGAAFKMINQLLAGVHIAAASEAIAFAAKQGLDIRKVYEVITASAGNSWMFENRMPHVLDGDYAPRSAVGSSHAANGSARRTALVPRKNAANHAGSTRQPAVSAR